PDRKNDRAGRRNKKTWQILQFFEIGISRSNGISTLTGLRTARSANLSNTRSVVLGKAHITSE
ncbi:hypothetical protein, partial [Dorea longicatena]|uniref:hypothetical protein n=1 Tax=Dorea longicatena TaxID=88431 RepID=UPI0032C1540C